MGYRWHHIYTWAQITWSLTLPNSPKIFVYLVIFGYQFERMATSHGNRVIWLVDSFFSKFYQGSSYLGPSINLSHKNQCYFSSHILFSSCFKNLPPECDSFGHIFYSTVIRNQSQKKSTDNVHHQVALHLPFGGTFIDIGIFVFLLA